MREMFSSTSFACVIALLVSPPDASAVAFRRVAINPNSEFSACAAIDVNRDGRLDIFCGGFWYEAPDWKRHTTREVPMIRGRFDDYSNQPLDVDGDGWMDVISMNYRSKSLFWIEHPGEQLGVWKTHLIESPGSSETGRLADLDNDGQLDVLPNGTEYAAWFRFERDSQHGVRWHRHELPDALIGHGLGVGDLNQDGRTDLVAVRGWAEAPADSRKQRWGWHSEFELHRDASIPILVSDVDGDGDADLIWGRGHNIGLYWLEQVSESGKRQWILHAIDTSWSGAHSIQLADIDADGRDDLVAGKRYLGHGGKDPGEYDPLAVYWYRFDSPRRVWQRQVVSLGGNCGFDLDPKCVDLDGDGDIDILAPTRAGLHLLENLSARQEQVASDTARSLPAPGPADHSKLLRVSDEDNSERGVETGFDWGLRRWQILRGMEQAMGPLPSSESRVPLQMRISGTEDTEKYRRLKISYVADAGDRVPAYLLMPKGISGKTPAILCLHPTSPLGKSQICGLGGKPSRYYAHELAERGFVCLAPDYPSFGDYSYDFDSDAYASGTMKAIWNNIRAMDLLESLPMVNRDRIACVGHSLGGHNALFTAAFDQRVRAVVTSCGFNAFSQYYGGDLTGWSSDRYMPRIRQRFDADPRQMPFDFHEVIAAMSPRPVFISAPLHDSNFAVAGVREVVDSAMAVYRFHKVPERLHAVYPDAEHDFPGEIRQQAYEWLEEHLK